MSFERLVEGFRDFQSEYFTGDTELYQKLIVDGQSPEALVIACSDSRIDPGIVMRAEPGDIFSVRNVAAMVPRYQADGRAHGTSAAIEYAVTALKVQYIIIMGHALCGGVRALAESKGEMKIKKDFISRWISIGGKARDLVRKIFPHASIEEHARILEKASILVSLKNLMTFPYVKEAVEAGKLQLHGWYFDFPNGKILEYNAQELRFKDILDGVPMPSVGSFDGACNCKDHEINITKYLNRIKAENKISTEPPEDGEIFVKGKRHKIIKKIKRLAYGSAAAAAAAASAISIFGIKIG
jgi:carbonic anhydrase